MQCEDKIARKAQLVKEKDAAMAELAKEKDAKTAELEKEKQLTEEQNARITQSEIEKKLRWHI